MKFRLKMDYQLKQFDFFLALCAMALTAIGVILIGSANAVYQSRQLAGAAIGVLAMAGVSVVDYKAVVKSGWLLYGIGIALLLGVTIAGSISGGAARWIEIGPLRFQPSEMTKILLIVFYSWLCAENRERTGELKFVLFYIGVCLVPAVLILEQPDLSTAIIVTWVSFCILFAAGLAYKMIVRALAAGVPLGGVLLYLVTRPDQQILSGYQYRRIMAWLSPQEWAQDSYQQRYSMMAIGSGRIMGKGLGNDSPLSVKNGNFLPELHTDFIMAVAGEELGFLGCCVILLLLGLIVFECLRIGARARDMAGRLLCTGVAVLIAGQAFVNLCVVTGLMPNTGLTLPFVSYGLSSLVSLYIGLGMVLNVGMQRDRYENGRQQNFR